VVNGQGIPSITATRTGLNISCTKGSTIMEKFQYLWVQAMAFHLDGFPQLLQCHAAAMWIPHCHLVQVHMEKAFCISKCHQKGFPQGIVWSSHTPPVIKCVCHFTLTVMAASTEWEKHCISPTRMVPDKTVCRVLIHEVTINAHHYSTTMGHLRETNTILVCSKT